MNLKNIKQGNRIYDVTALEQYYSNKDAYLKGYTAIEYGDWVLPIISDQDKGPGIIINHNSPFSRVRLPETDDPNIDQYRTTALIDFTNTVTMGQYMEKQQLVQSLEREILTSPDNITSPIIDKTDKPAMRLLKQAIIDKNFDLDKYEYRFGTNYNNDKRLLNKDNISLPMLVRMCNNTDIKAELVLSDASPDVPNPMGCVRRIELTGGGIDDNE